MWQAISQQLSDTLLFNFQITERVKVPGGDINDCYMISDGNERYFVKVNQREFEHQPDLYLQSSIFLYCNFPYVTVTRLLPLRQISTSQL